MDRNQSIIRTSVVGISVNFVLVCFKTVVGFLSGSITIVLDAVNNLSDALSSVITIVGAKLASKPPDKEHPYGHGRIEDIAATVIAVLVVAAGFSALQEAINRILHPVTPRYNAVFLIIIAAAIAVKLLLGGYLSQQGKKYHSEALTASGEDSLMDAAVSFSTLISAIVNLIWHINLEGYISAAISFAIIRAGIQMVGHSLSGIIGQRFEKDTAVKLRQRIGSYPPVLGVFDLTLHQYGSERVIGSVYIETEENMTVGELQRVTHQICEDIKSEFGIALTIGVYAANTTDTVIADEIKDSLLALLHEHREVLRLCGFYVDMASSVVSFKLIMDFEAKDPSKTKSEIEAALSAKYPQYRFDIVTDYNCSD